MLGAIFFLFYAAFASIIGILMFNDGLMSFATMGSIFIAYFGLGRSMSNRMREILDELLIVLVVFLGIIVWGCGLVKGIDVLVGIDLIQLANNTIGKQHLHFMGIIINMCAGFGLGYFGMISDEPNKDI